MCSFEKADSFPFSSTAVTTAYQFTKNWIPIRLCDVARPTSTTNSYSPLLRP